MGRPRRFDEIRLLDVAQELFWTRGYDRASVDDIAEASGVGNGSIYAAYRSKLGLFLAVFRRYCDARVASVEQVVADHHGRFDDAVAHYLAAIVAECAGWSDRRGCLMLNSIAELGTRFPAVQSIARDAIDRMQAVLTDRVQRAVDERDLDLPPADVSALGAHILLVSQGLIHLSRVGVPESRLREVAAISGRMSAFRSAA